jgi:hypothetical protein
MTYPAYPTPRSPQRPPEEWIATKRSQKSFWMRLLVFELGRDTTSWARGLCEKVIDRLFSLLLTSDARFAKEEPGGRP